MLERALFWGLSVLSRLGLYEHHQKQKNLIMNNLTKISWLIGLLAVILMFLLNNLSHRKAVGQVQTAVLNIYKDRLVAKHELIRLYRILHEKELSLYDSATVAPDAELAIANIIERYQATYLTKEEQAIFSTLRTELAKLTDLYAQPGRVRAKMLAIERNLHLVDRLVQIQMEEGERQLFLSKDAMTSIKLTTNFQLGFLIMLMILVPVFLWFGPQAKKGA